MNFHKIFIFLVVIFIFSSCSKKEEKISIIEEKNLEMQMIEAYNEGIKELDSGDVRFAAKNLMKLNFYIHNQFGLHVQL